MLDLCFFNSTRHWATSCYDIIIYHKEEKLLTDTFTDNIPDKDTKESFNRRLDIFITWMLMVRMESKQESACVSRCSSLWDLDGHIALCEAKMERVVKIIIISTSPLLSLTDQDQGNQAVMISPRLSHIYSFCSGHQHEMAISHLEK